MNYKNTLLSNFLKSHHFRVDLFFHFTLLILVYTVMFVFVISKLVKTELINVINYNFLNKYLNYYNNNNDNELDTNINLMIEYMKNKKYEEKDLTIMHNKKLRFILYISVSLITLLVAIIIFLYIKKRKITLKNVGRLFLENILLFTIIGVIEIIFAFNIATKYTSINPSFLINYFIKSFNKKYRL